MPWTASTVLGRVEVKCWGAGAEGAGHAMGGVGMTRQGDVEAGEAGKRVRAVGAVP